MARKRKILYSNQSPHGWWIFCEVQRWVPANRKKRAAAKRFLVWENMRIIQSRDREQAYRKAIKLAKAGMPSKTHGGEWQFSGISLLLPIYDELADGSEIWWTDHGLIGAEKLKQMVKRKKELSVFDDRDRL